MTRQPQEDTRALLFDRLALAWAEGRKVRIWYPHTSARGHTYLNARLVCPYFLEPNPSGHTHYLIGHDEFSGQVRTFKMERIQQVEVTEERFEIPADFDIDARLRHAWGISDEDVIEVRLRFHDAAAAARARESRWHSSQREDVRADGTVDITYEVGGLLEITHWVLGWGAAVEVLAPFELRKQVANTVRAQAELYADMSSST
jgi:proteasome accessory factor B